MSPPTKIKIVVVGDAAVGKTCLLITKKENEFPTDYVPTVFDNSHMEFTVDERKINADLWDTAGQEDFDRLRPLCYPHTDVFILCFSLVNPDSLENVRAKWLPELQHHAPRTPFLLVGTKEDLRNNLEKIAELDSQGMKPISQEQGAQNASRIGAAKYMECSALTRKNINNVFDESVRVAFRAIRERKDTRAKKECIIL